MEKHKHERSTFSGKIGFVLSAAGASVGLGNIWRFPYLAAKYGGGIFLLIYKSNLPGKCTPLMFMFLHNSSFPVTYLFFVFFMSSQFPRI